MNDTRIFHDLHATGFLLPNAWDAASARLFEAAGFPAVGTTSAGISYARGRPDKQSLSRGEMLREVQAIVETLRVPVNADIEAGYGDAPDVVRQTVREFAALGVAGVNLEDATGRPEQPLYSLEDQMRRVSAAREAAPDIFLNIRTDTFITGYGRDEGERLAETIRRGRAYLEAGADGIFVPLAVASATISVLAQDLSGPLNVMAFPGAPSVPNLLQAGAKRVSVGQSVMLAVMGLTARIAQELHETGTYDTMKTNFYGFNEAEVLFAYA